MTSSQKAKLKVRAPAIKSRNYETILDETLNLKTKTEIEAYDEYSKSLINLFLHSKLSDNLSAEDIQEFSKYYLTNPDKLNHELNISILPVQSKYAPWESITSRRIRWKLKKKKDELLNKIEPNDLIMVDAISINGEDVNDMSIKYDEFKNKGIAIIKKPKKRKNDFAGISAFAYDIYIGNSKFNVIGYVKAETVGRKRESFPADDFKETLLKDLFIHLLKYNEYNVWNYLQKLANDYNLKSRQSFNAMLSFNLILRYKGNATLFYTGPAYVGTFDTNKFVELFYDEQPMIGEYVQEVKSGRVKRFVELQKIQVNIKQLPNAFNYVLLNSELKPRLPNIQINRKNNILKSAIKESRKHGPFKDDVVLVYSA